MYRVGIDIGGTKMNIGILDADNKIVISKKVYIKDIIDITVAVKNTLQELCNEAGISFDSLATVGMGIPGTVSDDGKKILKAPNISILSDDVAIRIEKELGLPTALVQDSRAAAWGEYLCGGGKGTGTVVCVTLGTGIGTGIVLDGKIYNGALGSAGELGHIPVCENGRPCGCGKTGCLEKYCAGGGLDITAAELLGEGKTAADLFAEAKVGNEKAIEKINEAVSMLGGALVSIINLLSPDCLLLSGGLSEQEELYVKPLIDYITKHCYTSGKMPIIKKAELGESAPMVGAALVPNAPKRKQILSASIMCADFMNFGKALKEMEDAGIEYLHCDIMDNHFVPNLMLPMEMLNKIHEETRLPFDYHIMAYNPESIIEKITIKEGDIVAVHYEATPHLHMVINKIIEKGGKAAVAINPSTPISVLDEILPYLHMVLIMSVNPGFAGQKIVPTSFDKIKRMREKLDNEGYSDVIIEVDGNCSFENVPKMYKAGAEIFVVGTSSVFKKGLTIKEGADKLFETLKGE